ncbi:hypothetical protein [Streptomyces griseus]
MSQSFEVAEESLGREIFGPLGGIVELGAVTEAGADNPLRNVSVTDFVSRHQKELNETIIEIQRIGNFDSTTMAIIGELGWNQSHEITAPSLLLWSGGIEEFSPQLERASSVQRMLRAGSDLQMTRLLHALVGAAVARNQIAAVSCPMIARILKNAATLLGIDRDDAAQFTFRMWRTAFLPGILMPSTHVSETARKVYREFAHELEDILS